MCYIQTSS